MSYLGCVSILVGDRLSCRLSISLLLLVVYLLLLSFLCNLVRLVPRLSYFTLRFFSPLKGATRASSLESDSSLDNSELLTFSKGSDVLTPPSNLFELGGLNPSNCSSSSLTESSYIFSKSLLSL